MTHVIASHSERLIYTHLVLMFQENDSAAFSREMFIFTQSQLIQRQQSAYITLRRPWGSQDIRVCIDGPIPRSIVADSYIIHP